MGRKIVARVLLVLLIVFVLVCSTCSVGLIMVGKITEASVFFGGSLLAIVLGLCDIGLGRVHVYKAPAFDLANMGFALASLENCSLRVNGVFYRRATCTVFEAGLGLITDDGEPLAIATPEHIEIIDETSPVKVHMRLGADDVVCIGNDAVSVEVFSDTLYRIIYGFNTAGMSDNLAA